MKINIRNIVLISFILNTKNRNFSYFCSMKKLGIIGCGWLGKKIGFVLQDKFEIFATTTSKEFELFSIGFTTKKINFDEKITIN